MIEQINMSVKKGMEISIPDIELRRFNEKAPPSIKSDENEHPALLPSAGLDVNSLNYEALQ